MQTQEIAKTFRKCADTLEGLFYDRNKLFFLIGQINQRDDVTDDCRRLIQEVLHGKKGTH